MFAVIKTGGKQYKVTANNIIKVEKLELEPGSEVELKDVLMVRSATGTAKIGTPFVSGASVTAEVLDQMRTPKILIFKKKRRQKYRRKNGHRQHMTVLKIKSINA